jgi:hypothetical protein
MAEPDATLALLGPWVESTSPSGLESQPITWHVVTCGFPAVRLPAP